MCSRFISATRSSNGLIMVILWGLVLMVTDKAAAESVSDHHQPVVETSAEPHAREDDLGDDEMGESPIGFTLGVHRRRYESKINDVNSGKGLMLAFDPGVVYKFRPGMWYAGLGYYFGKSRFTGLSGDMGELYRLMGPTLAAGMELPFHTHWIFRGTVAVDVLWLRGDIDVNSQTTEFAQGSRRYSGGPQVGVRLQAASEYRLAENMVVGIQLGYGFHKGEADFDDGIDMVSRAKLDATGMLYGLSLAFVSR